MTRYTKVINAVKEVLEDDEKMKKICTFKENELNECVETAKIRWRLNQLLENADFQEKNFSHVPDDLQYLFCDVIADDGTVQVSSITIVLDSLHDYDKEESTLLKERIEHLLKYADFDISKYKDVSSKLEEYENALSDNKSGYRPFYKRDVSETMVNTYNPEWLSAWNGNMDIQLCLDFFAVITYISDYYSKDDSGTMQLLIDALKDAENEDLRTKLKRIKSVFLTHRQMGESEAYYRILPHMHLKDSNVEAVFAPTGFNPSHFLQRIEDDKVDLCEDAVEVEGREGKYKEKASMYDKYLRRDCDAQPELHDLCYSQFVKRYSSARTIPKDYKFKLQKIPKTFDEDGKLILRDLIITKNIENDDEVSRLPSCIKLKDAQDNELSFIKLRAEAILRYHKFKKSKNLHEHLFSELQLYHPHTNNRKDGQQYCLIDESNDLEVCQKTYDESEIFRVKRRIMPFLETVEEGMEAAHELRNTIGDELDPQNELDQLECQEIGIQDNPEYATKDFTGVTDETEALATPGLFKTISIKTDEEVFQLIHCMDNDQRMVLDVAVS